MCTPVKKKNGHNQYQNTVKGSKILAAHIMSNIFKCIW